MKRLFLPLLLLTASFALAHDPGISNATLELGASPVTIRLTYAVSDLLLAGVDATDDKELNAAASRMVEWRTAEGPAAVQVQSAKVMDKTTVEFVLEAPRVAGSFQSLLLPDMPPGHRQLLVLRDAKEESYRIQMLSAKSAVEVISNKDLDKTKPPASPMAAAAPAASHFNLAWCFSGLLMLGVAGVLIQRRGKMAGHRLLLAK